MKKLIVGKKAQKELERIDATSRQRISEDIQAIKEGREEIARGDCLTFSSPEEFKEFFGVE